MTSESYLKFLAVTNCVNYGMYCISAFILLNYNDRSLRLGTLIALVIVFTVTSFIQIRYPASKGISTTRTGNKDPMKQSILYWAKDERELMSALKTTAHGYVYSAHFLMIVPFLILFFALTKLPLVQLLNLILLIFFLFWAFLNVKYVTDFKNYSQEG
ncbi:hypothetical protein KUA55_08920 [Enterococcus sp. ALS3]|uniref:DUF3169 family protein n=1 Tax=Enterococcus alishanensis TaxID=1303817 RepID=A0ABS6TCZ6_9ENTE|nr:hypothetical protein [Enterococcus alishanensis]MBV7390800.1 hypothetical protein [Enterococcus alishanensis]